MGTNFYAKSKITNKTIHIGKSSGGWCFGLHVYVTVGEDNELIKQKTLFSLNPHFTLPYDFESWKKLIENPLWYIEDEYGNKWCSRDMLETIECRRWHNRESWEDVDWKLYGYHSEEHFHSLNHSERGPNGLLRSKIDMRHCVGHGEGTYDYLIGDFS